MQTSANLQATSSAAATSTLAKRKSPKTSFVATAVAAIEAIRADAIKHHAQWEMPGRKSMLDMMARVYAQYHAAKSSTEYEQFMNNVRSKLNTLNIKFRETSPETTQLIRFAFFDLSDKQVHVYGRSLDVAYTKGKLPPEFVKFVEETPGRFDGIRRGASSAATAPTVETLSKSVTALSEAENETTLETLEVVDWAEGETYRVLIAVRNANDKADLKDAKLSPDLREKALLMYLANKQALTKAGNAPLDDAGREAMGLLFVDLPVALYIPLYRTLSP